MWGKGGRWMVSNMNEIKDNPPANAYYVTNYFEDIDE
jgi:hypothetical protein